MQVNNQKTTVKKKTTYFLKNYVASSLTFFCEDFTTQCLDVRFPDLLYLYLFEVPSTVLVSYSQGENDLI